MAAAGGSLSVIALISGGKDSFYSILHCQANGHRVVALANLYPSGAAEEDIAHQTESQSPPSPSSLLQKASQGAPVPHQHGSSSALETDDRHAEDNSDEDSSETDLNSFMYQTVGHQIIPLYAKVIGLPLYRQPIVGTAVHNRLSYQNPHPQRLVPATGSVLRPSADHLSSATQDLRADEKDHELQDETESLVPLLRAVLKAHPEANALCTGAILSTYQRTRVESVALRLGLVPLSYLWQFTELPASVPSSSYDPGINLAEEVTRSSRDTRRHVRKRRQPAARDDARLLRDMAAIGLEARIVKVASAGLDEGFLWENVASETGVQRVERAMRRFGVGGGRGSILGEGGEFETLVVDGPRSLFKGRITVSDDNRRVIREGGGCEWLSFSSADFVMKDELEQGGEIQTHKPGVRIPDIFDPRFEDTMQCLLVRAAGDKQRFGFVSPLSCDDNTKSMANLGSFSSSISLTVPDLPKCQLSQSFSSQEWYYLGSSGAGSGTVEEQTVSIVNEIRRQLDEHALPTMAITNSVIVLRHMSDFPLVNERYGSLFLEPNPPSRVTISCGDELLPRDAAIAVYLTVQLRLQLHERQGLHVQSRSYWAPANIGPYSQAIAFPVLPLSTAEAVTGDDGEDGPHQHFHTSSSPLAVSIAGQIPLLPASMVLPPPATPHHAEQQITLALQHLWRVGVEMQVRWWTSAVAYFPATPSREAMQHQALLAATAWKAAHIWPDLDSGDEADSSHDENGISDDDDDDDDDDTGPDLWDRRYNAQFMTYGGGDEKETFPLPLPDWGVVKGFDADADASVLLNSKITQIPFCFAVEVEELPRQAGVEWHAHLGLAKLQSGSVTRYSTAYDRIPSPEACMFDLGLHHIVVESEYGVFIQTSAALRSSVGSHDENQRIAISAEVLRSVSIATATSLEKLLTLSSFIIRPKITYTESLQVPDRDSLEEIGALIPCRSLWDPQGRRLSAVCIFETRAAKVK
ncbi:adenine nucleotide alpha hydrolases-like protein [Xylariaceae sp. AK1471]|nr:adenine nucleotide alpha hydrolases-like protein [Xylariaceae sp. AK1471]